MLYDCVIVGGGAVGLSLALSLSQFNLKVAVIEKEIAKNKSDLFSARTLALSSASIIIYQSLGLWDKLAPRATPIESVLVSVMGQYGSCYLHNEKQPLGQVVACDDLELALYDALSELESINIFRPAIVTDYRPNQHQWDVGIKTADQQCVLSTRLLVGADGLFSPLRAQQAITFDKKEYGHHAIIANVQIQSPKKFTAFERFLPHGAIAFIPWQDDFATCILTTQDPAALMKLNDDDYLKACQKLAGSRIGKMVRLSKRVSFSLSMQIASQQSGSRFLLMGNAAHNLHPIAAQGLNLSLRDIWQIHKQLLNGAAGSEDIGSTSFITEYVNARRKDQDKTIFATDKIARFMSGSALPSWLRAFGLVSFDMVSPAKRIFTTAAMGLSCL